MGSILGSPYFGKLPYVYACMVLEFGGVAGDLNLLVWKPRIGTSKQASLRSTQVGKTSLPQHKFKKDCVEYLRLLLAPPT